MTGLVNFPLVYVPRYAGLGAGEEIAKLLVVPARVRHPERRRVDAERLPVVRDDAGIVLLVGPHLQLERLAAVDQDAPRPTLPARLGEQRGRPVRIVRIFR